MMMSFDWSRRSFLTTSLGWVGTASLLSGSLRAQSNQVGGPLMAYVGTFSSPLRDMLPTQVDLPPGNGRGIHLFQVDRISGAMSAAAFYDKAWWRTTFKGLLQPIIAYC